MVTYCQMLFTLVLEKLYHIISLYIWCNVLCVYSHSCRVPAQMFESLLVPAFPGWCSRARPSQVSSRGTLWGAWGPCCWTRAWMSERRPLGPSGESVQHSGVDRADRGLVVYQKHREGFESSRPQDAEQSPSTDTRWRLTGKHKRASSRHHIQQMKVIKTLLIRLYSQQT